MDGNVEGKGDAIVTEERLKRSPELDHRGAADLSSSVPNLFSGGQRLLEAVMLYGQTGESRVFLRCAACCSRNCDDQQARRTGPVTKHDHRFSRLVAGAGTWSNWGEWSGLAEGP